MTYTIIHYKENQNRDLVAKASFTAETPAGFQIRNITLFRTPEGKSWLSLPSREYMQDGKKKYFPLVGFKDRDANDRFLANLMTALNDYLASGVQIDQLDVQEPPF